MKTKKEVEITEKDILEFLQRCDKIENRNWTTDDGNTYSGWIFTLLISSLKDIDDTIMPTDMTIAVRGEYKLHDAVRVAIKLKNKGF